MFKVVVKGITKEFERSYRDYVYGTMAAAASASFRLRPGVRPLAIVVIALAADTAAVVWARSRPAARR